MARRDIIGAVDFAHLETYAAHDAALIEEVLGLFRQQAELWMPLLDPARAEGWRDAAHALKGSALGVGAFAFADACSAAEAGAQAGAATRAAQLERIRTALDAALHDIAAYRHEQALQGLKTPRA
ncbi:Hpt domain-containing protein [Caulobacter sp. S45]|uniref:Hpt domain-containing protein n=1 Tax=Caulobacter sp. S45 TaxID=1641861 RepID=UPI00157655CC|nr:Hpt domain-containing protein [Caulobacter sp. S45]